MPKKVVGGVFAVADCGSGGVAVVFVVEGGVTVVGGLSLLLLVLL